MNRWKDLLILAVVAGALAIGVWQILSVDGPANAKEPRRPRAAAKRAVTQDAVVEAPKSAVEAEAPMATPAAPVEPIKQLPPEEDVVWRQVTTNSSGTVTEKFKTADGRSHRVIRHPKRTFSNASDQLIAMAVSAAKRGGTMPPLPLTDATEADFLESLNTPIVIEDGDSDEVKELKMEVAAVREELKGLIKGGMTVREALEAHQSQVNSNAAYREEALEILNQLKAEGDSEGAEQFRLRINEDLQGRGIDPLKGMKGSGQ